FKMELAQTNTGNTPKSYSLNMFKDFVPMCVFSESNQGKLSCEGKVEHKFDMEPHSDNLANYGKLCRERTQKYMVKSRQVQVLDNDHGMSMRPMPGIVGLISSSSKEKKKQAPVKPSDAKRTRRDRTEMENVIFKLFERQPNWALKALVQETDQPEQFLKEILNDLCLDTRFLGKGKNHVTQRNFRGIYKYPKHFQTAVADHCYNKHLSGIYTVYDIIYKIDNMWTQHKHFHILLFFFFWIFGLGMFYLYGL
ncbi:hypothetical protein ACJX0J_034720, partial [Zea mays]